MKNTIHNSLLSSIYENLEGKAGSQNSRSVLWNHYSAFQNYIVSVMHDLNRIFDYRDLLYLYVDFLKSIITSKNTATKNYLFVEQVLSILYSYEMFIINNE